MPDNWPEDTPRLIRPAKRGVEWILAGSCPRCLHDITRDLGPTGGLGFGEGADRVIVKCNCGGGHEGSKDGGCGAVGYTPPHDVTDRPPFEVSAAGPATAPELRAHRWVEGLVVDQLTAWRGLASTWWATVSVLLGLLGAGTVFS